MAVVAESPSSEGRGASSHRAVRGRLIATAASALLAVVLFLPAAITRKEFVGDEAAKISESFFARLILRGDFSNPAWFAHEIHRTNPPVGKFIFGVAMILAGEEPPLDPAL